MRATQQLPFQADVEALVTRLVTRHTGGRPKLDPGEIGELAWGVSTLWEGFTGERGLAGVDYLANPTLLAAYSLYYLPRSYVQARLALRHLISARVDSVLDVGSGPGPLLLACRDQFPQARRLVALDHDDRALQVAKGLTGATTHRAKLPNLGGLAGDARFDLVTAGLVVNELFQGDPAAVAKRAAFVIESLWPKVEPGGHLVIIEPALKETGRAALELRNLLVAAGLPLIAPCTHALACPALTKERDWCHAGLRYEPPQAVRSIGKAVGIDPSDVRFVYFVFRKGEAVTPNGDWRVVSERLVEKGKQKAWICGAPGRLLLERQDKHATEANAAFDVVQRDDLIRIADAESRPEVLRLNAASTVERLQTASGG